MTDDRTESRDLAHHQAGPALARRDVDSQAQQRLSQTLQMVREAMLNPDVDANKAKVMAELMTSLEDRAQKQEFNRDLNAAMREMPVITRQGEIIIPANRTKGTPARKQGKFARFEDIDRVVRPVLDRYNLTIRFEVGNENNQITVRPVLSHGNGYTERGEAMRLPADTSGSKNDTQAVGSAVQYGKRYVYCAALNIVTEGVDDDGTLGALTAPLPYEREQLVRADAEMAHGQGIYRTWFDGQPPKDRAFLVASGLHQQYGGKAMPALAGRSAKAAPRQEDDDQGGGGPPAQPEQPEPTARRAKAQTPREWADLVKAELPKCHDLDTLNDFWEGKSDLLDRLKASNPTLWQELTDAYRARKDEIDEGRLV